MDNSIALKLRAEARSLLRDGRTLLPTTPAEIAAQLNGKRSAASKLAGWVRRMRLSRLRWELGHVEAALKAIPGERRVLLDENERRWSDKATAIIHEADRRDLECNQRAAVLRIQIKRLEKLA